MSAATTSTRLPAEQLAALRAWADIDRFELAEVLVDLAEGWAASGVIERDQVPVAWPPRPEKIPDDPTKVLSTRVTFGCMAVRDLEDLLDRLFSDDLRFVQTGVRRPRRARNGRPSRDQPQTCRGSFRLDAAGNPLAGSFEYAPLIDFAKHVEHKVATGVDLDRAVGQSLDAIRSREDALVEAYAEVVESADSGTAALLTALSRVRVQHDHTRFHTTWIGPADDPQGQVPAFFREDLLQATRQPASPPLGRYLRGRPDTRPPSPQDLEERHHLEPYLDPARLPRAAWPTGHVLRLSQQVALTAVLAPEADSLTAVNGPPGTGKTTLLRDLYANLVTRRAEVMVGFDDPVQAWGVRQELGSVNQQRWSFHAPDEALCGFEMVLASSNNAAAENVSKELPDSSSVKGAVGERLSYFRADSNDEPYLKGVAEKKAGRRRPGLLEHGKQSWGLAAVALGSRDRVGRFEEVVGRFHSAHTTSALLRTLGGPPSALTEWESARRLFRSRRDAVEAAIAAIATQLAEDEELRQVRSRLADRRTSVEQAWTSLETAAADSVVARAEATRFEGAVSATRLRLEEHEGSRPSWWSRLTGQGNLDSWQTTATMLKEAAWSAESDHSARLQVLAAHEQREERARREWQSADGAWRSDLARSEQLGRRRGRAGQDPGWWVGEEWWSRRADDSGPGSSREAVELGSAWVDARLQLLREELFEAALIVHESFVRRSRSQVRANLRTWLALQSHEVQNESADEVTLGAWQSLFLVVPLVSTTFASVSRLLQRVPTGSLGWLVVDEAGQALPGSAVGALARCRRAVVVGDPLQLEPVVTLPRALVDQLMAHHRAPSDLAPTRASVQTLADSVSRLGTIRLRRWISLPLVVHNRCLEPMFGIANEMAYDEKMVHGRKAVAEQSGGPGPSRWIDVPRPAGSQDHYDPGDWDALRELMAQLDWEAEPSLAIISPFKRVTRALAPKVAAAVEEQLLRRRQPPSGKELRDLVESVRVGTVHTFQGREYDTVVLVLGGATAGARSWAAGTPNLLNVAVTRAKDRLFVIGDRRAWRTTGHAATLDQGLQDEVGDGSAATLSPWPATDA